MGLFHVTPVKYTVTHSIKCQVKNLTGAFYLTGLVTPSNSKRSYRVFIIEREQRIFVGYITKKALVALLNADIPQADICKWVESQEKVTNKEQLDFSWRNNKT